MQVLEHQQDRRGGRQLGEQAEHAAEHLLSGQSGAVLVGSLPVAAVGKQQAQRRARGKRPSRTPVAWAAPRSASASGR